MTGVSWPWLSVVRLQTPSLVIGVMLGSVAATAAGLWWMVGVNSTILARVDAQSHRLENIAARVQILEADDRQQIADVNTLRGRADKMEDRLPPYAASASVLDAHAAHISALDGRIDEVVRNMNLDMTSVRDRMLKLCVGIENLSAASGRKAGCD